MTEGDMSFLALVVAAAAVFALTLAWATHYSGHRR